MSQSRTSPRMSPALEDAVIAALQEQGQALGRMQADISRILGLSIIQDRRMTRMEHALGIEPTGEFEVAEKPNGQVVPINGHEDPAG